MSPRPELGPFKRQPRIKQLECLKRSADKEYFAIFFEQRCGKSQVVLDTAAYNYRLGRIDMLLIIAPNGVHRNWITDEIPSALPDDVNAKCVLWQTGKMEQKGRKQELRDLLDHPGLAVLSVNIDALLSDYTKKTIKFFQQKRKVLTVIDESLDISRWSQRTKQSLAIAKHSVMRRILDGTPVDATPLGLFYQCKFLAPQEGLLGHSSMSSFKNYYAEWDTEAPFPKLKGYRNLDELQERLRAFSMRVTRQECVDLPPKVREKRYFSLPPEHRRIYEQMRRDFIAELGDKILDAPLAMTRYLRLQQITSNHLPMRSDPIPCQHCGGQSEDCPVCDGYGVIAGQETLERISEHDPRLEAFADVVSKTQGQGIVWAKFRADYEALAAWAKREKVPVVFYHGSVHPDERAEAIRKFQRGEARLFIGNPRSGGRGIDLSAANFVVYYSLDWPLRWRRQSEDRAISLAKLDSVLYFDLIAEHTVDEKIISALRSGKELSDLVTGDKPENWL